MPNDVHVAERPPAESTREGFYGEVLRLLAKSGYPFLLSGTNALALLEI